MYVPKDVPASPPYLGPILFEILRLFPREALIFTIPEGYFFIVAVAREVGRVSISY